MNGPMIVTLATLAAASALFISGKIRADLVAVAALIVMMLTGVLKPEEALAGFSNSVVVMMIGLFVVGGGIFSTGLAKLVSRKLLQLAGTNETRLLLMVMVATASIGAFVSNTGTVAVMMPIVVSLAYSAETTPGRLLMPLAFASSLGGMLTSIGTPPNLVIQEALAAGGHGQLKFFSFAPTGIICLFTGILAMLYLRRFLPKNEGSSVSKTQRRSAGELEQEYRLAEHLLRVQVLKGSPLLDKTLLELRIPSRFQLTVIEIRRKISARNQIFKTINQEVAGPESIIQEEDILYIHGASGDAAAFAAEYGLHLLDSLAMVESGGSKGGAYATSDMGLAEVMLKPQSRLIGKLVKESGFREKYRLNVLGIQGKDQYLLRQVKEEKMRFGDALLVQGTWEDISLLATTASEVIVVGQPLEESRKITMDRKAPIAAGILLLLIVLLVTEWVPAVAAVMIAA